MAINNNVQRPSTFCERLYRTVENTTMRDVMTKVMMIVGAAIMSSIFYPWIPIPMAWKPLVNAMGMGLIAIGFADDTYNLGFAKGRAHQAGDISIYYEYLYGRPRVN